MNAVELLLGRHEVPIDPSIIRPIRSQDNVSVVEFGVYTRLIYECLRLANGKPCTATQVAIHITVSLEWDLDQKTFAEFRYQIRQRTKKSGVEGANHPHPESGWQYRRSLVSDPRRTFYGTSTYSSWR